MMIFRQASLHALSSQRTGCRYRKPPNDPSRCYTRRLSCAGECCMNAPVRLLYPEAEAARMLAVCARTMRTFRQRGQISYISVGGRICYAPEDLQRFIESNRQCESIPAKAPPTSGSAQRFEVADFAEALAKRRGGQPNSQRTVSSRPQAKRSSKSNLNGDCAT